VGFQLGSVEVFWISVLQSGQLGSFSWVRVAIQEFSSQALNLGKRAMSGSFRNFSEAAPCFRSGAAEVARLSCANMLLSKSVREIVVGPILPLSTS